MRPATPRCPALPPPDRLGGERRAASWPSVKIACCQEVVVSESKGRRWKSACLVERLHHRRKLVLGVGGGYVDGALDLSKLHRDLAHLRAMRVAWLGGKEL